MLYDYFPGNNLSGRFKEKVVIASITIGGSKERYTPPHKTVETYLIPLQETFEIIGAEWELPVYSFDAVLSNKNLSKTALQHFLELEKRINKNNVILHERRCW